jgi:hypothetical protein
MILATDEEGEIRLATLRSNAEAIPRPPADGRLTQLVRRSGESDPARAIGPFGIAGRDRPWWTPYRMPERQIPSLTLLRVEATWRTSIKQGCQEWCRKRDSNPRPPHYE